METTVYCPLLLERSVDSSMVTPAPNSPEQDRAQYLEVGIYLKNLEANESLWMSILK